MSKTENTKTINKDWGRAIYIPDGLEPHLGNRILYKGEVYPSHAALERKLSIKKGSISNVMRKGLDIPEAVEWCIMNCEHFEYPEKEPAPNVDDLPAYKYCKPITYNGKTYRSQQSAERNLGMKKGYIGSVKRIYGYTAEQVIERFFNPEKYAELEKKPHASAKPVSYKGVDYESRSACAEATGVDIKLFTARLNAGWSVEDAIEKPKNISLEGEIDFNGTTYSNELELCRAHNIGISTFKQRLADGWPFDVALTYPVPKGKKSCPVFFEGTVYSSIKTFAKAFNLKYNLLIVELRKGKSKADCVKNPLLKLKEGENFEDFAKTTEFNRLKSAYNRSSLAYACTCSPYAMFEN